MRTFLMGLFVGSFVASTLVAAVPQSNKQRETKSVGTDLSLGMAEETVIKQLVEAGYSPRKIEPPKDALNKGITSMWLVEQTGEGNKRQTIGTVTFTSGRLHSAGKFLLPSDADQVEFGRQLYFAMRGLEHERDAQCVIETETEEVPDFATKTARLRCGKKAIVVMLQKSQQQSETVDLSEALGTIN
jgi:hypothetical protein